MVQRRVREYRGVRSEVLGFSKVSEQYERARPGYPVATVEWIVKAAGLGPGSVVVDLAAGTGKLTRLLHRDGRPRHRRRADRGDEGAAHGDGARGRGY